MDNHERRSGLLINIYEEDYYQALDLIAELPDDVRTPILQLIGKYDRRSTAIIRKAPNGTAAIEPAPVRLTTLSFRFGKKEYEAPIDDLYRICYLQDGVIKLPDQESTKVYVTQWGIGSKASGSGDYAVGAIDSVIAAGDPSLPPDLARTDLIVEATLVQGEPSL